MTFRNTPIRDLGFTLSRTFLLGLILLSWHWAHYWFCAGFALLWAGLFVVDVIATLFLKDSEFPPITSKPPTP